MLTLIYFVEVFFLLIDKMEYILIKIISSIQSVKLNDAQASQRVGPPIMVVRN
jgi:hypothetical protein